MAKGGAAQSPRSTQADGQTSQDGGRHNHLDGTAWDKRIVRAINRASHLEHISHALYHEVQRKTVYGSCAGNRSYAIKSRAILHDKGILRGSKGSKVR